MIRLGRCCIFREQPIKFVTTTATAIGKMQRPDALAKLSRLCIENADALLAALRYCADNDIGCFRVNSQILPIKTHPACGYRVEDLPDDDGVPKWRRRGSVAAVEFGGAQASVSGSREDGGFSLYLPQLHREAQECDPTWSFGKRFVSRS